MKISDVRGLRLEKGEAEYNMGFVGVFPGETKRVIVSKTMSLLGEPCLSVVFLPGCTETEEEMGAEVAIPGLTKVFFPGKKLVVVPTNKYTKALKKLMK